jgi:hypothetical protein
MVLGIALAPDIEQAPGIQPVRSIVQAPGTRLVRGIALAPDIEQTPGIQPVRGIA